MHKDYKIPRGVIFVCVAFVILAIIAIAYNSITFEDVYEQISKYLNSKQKISFGLFILILLAISHAILMSLKKNLEHFGKKSVLDFQIWMSSAFAAVGTGFISYTSLRVFNGLLGEKVANVQFLLGKDDAFVSWPFMVITIVCVVYCAIRIGSMFSEVISACQELMANKKVS